MLRPPGGMGRWGDGERGRRGDGETRRGGDAEMGREKLVTVPHTLNPTPYTLHPTSHGSTPHVTVCRASIAFDSVNYSKPTL